MYYVKEGWNTDIDVYEYWIMKQGSKKIIAIVSDRKDAKHIVAALEKQVPKKPVIKEWSPARCPTCGAELSEDMGDGYYKPWYSKKVCDCGQKLDWNEVES